MPSALASNYGYFYLINAIDDIYLSDVDSSLKSQKLKVRPEC